MTEEPTLVRIRDLGKRFGGVTAVDAVDLDLRRGEIVGLIGRNGSGKSTLLRHIPGMLRPDRGTCTTLGRAAHELRDEDLARIGYVDQEGELVPFLTVAAHIAYVRSYYSTWSDDFERRYIRHFRIPLEARVGTLSPGVRQQLAVLLATAFEPELLVLDEAAAAMDPLARAGFTDLLTEVMQDGRRSVVLASHILSDVEKVVDRVVMLDEGRVIRDAPLDELRDAYRRVRFTSTAGTLPQDLRLPGIVEAENDGRTALLTLRNVPLETIERAGIRLSCRVDVTPVAFDDIYRLEVLTSEMGLPR